MRAFVRDHDARGAQLAVSHEGRLVFARGFGWADEPHRRPITPTSLFRIASVSKPITATTVMQLVERARLRLNDRLVDILDLGATKDPRWPRITIAHLLQHRGGWDRERGIDPSFQTARLAKAARVSAMQLAPQHVIDYMRAQPLQFDPGSGFAYSNFGYCLLGRVIEKLGGAPYGSYVQREVLAPLGVTRMTLGRGGNQRASDEVDYDTRRDRSGQVRVRAVDDAPREAANSWRIELMDAHGGWLATSTDLLRFARSFDAAASPRIISKANVRAMYERPDGAAGTASDGRASPTYYGLGWNVRELGRPERINVWHTGSLDGTSALLVRRFDRISWAVLFNARTAPNGKRYSDLIDPLLHQAASEVKAWPRIDQFGELP